MSNPADRVRRLLSILANFTNEIEATFDDDQKTNYQEQLRQRRSDLETYTRRLDEAEKKGASGLADVMTIHSELLNRFFL